MKNYFGKKFHLPTQIIEGSDENIFFPKYQKMSNEWVVTSVYGLSVIVMMIKDEKNEKISEVPTWATFEHCPSRYRKKK